MERVTFQKWPETFPRNIDFLPSLKLQETLNPKQEICHVVARASRLDKIKSRPPRRLSSLILKQVKKETSHVLLQYGEPDFSSKMSNMDIANISELREGLGSAGFEDATIDQRVIIHEIPKLIEHHAVFQGYNNIFEAQVKSAKMPNQLKKMLGIHTWNQYPLMRANLLSEGIITSSRDKSLRKIQSGLVSEFMKPSDPNLGVFHFGDKLNVLETELAKDHPRRKRWWLDTGLPQTLSARLDDLKIDIRLFKLIKHDHYVAFSIPEGI